MKKQLYVAAIAYSELEGDTMIMSAELVLVAARTAHEAVGIIYTCKRADCGNIAITIEPQHRTQLLVTLEFDHSPGPALRVLSSDDHNIFIKPRRKEGNNK